MHVLTVVNSQNKITKSQLAELAKERFGDLVKGVVDIEKAILVLGGDLHADEEGYLLEQGSNQQYLWGINLYPAKLDEAFIEFDSMINLRPSQGNRSRGVDNPSIRQKIIEIVYQLIEAS